MNVIQFILEICTTYDETNLTDKINNELIDLAKEKDTIYLIHLLKQDHLHFACKFTNTNCDMKHLLSEDLTYMVTVLIICYKGN